MRSVYEKVLVVFGEILSSAHFLRGEKKTFKNIWSQNNFI